MPLRAWLPSAMAARTEVVEGGVAQVGFLGQQVAGFAEQGPGGVQDGAGNPGVEVVGTRGGVALGEFAAVGGSAPENGVREGCGVRVGDAPEFGGEAVVEGRDDQFQAGVPAQRGVAGQQVAHEGQGRAAQQQAHGGVGVLG
ncbi:hypothetical protein KGA66_20175, partial [Actinocrinis puniceicyclus]